MRDEKGACLSHNWVMQRGSTAYGPTNEKKLLENARFEGWKSPQSLADMLYMH